MRIQWPSRNTVTGRELALEFGAVYSESDALRRRIAALEQLSQASFGDTIDSFNVRRGSVAVVEGNNPIPFDKPLQSKDYALSAPMIKVSSTESALGNIVSKFPEGFTVYAPSAGTLDYTAIEI